MSAYSINNENDLIIFNCNNEQLLHTLADAPETNSIHLINCSEITDSGLMEIFTRGLVKNVQQVDYTGCPQLSTETLTKIVDLRNNVDFYSIVRGIHFHPVPTISN